MYASKVKSWFSNVLEPLSNSVRYFGDHTSLHGFRYVFSMSYIPLQKRVFWLIVVTASCVCATSVLLQVLKIYSEDAVSYLVETNYLEFDTPFPAVTICEQQNSDGVKSYISQHNLPSGTSSFLKDVSFWTAKFCKTCPNCKSHTCTADFQNAINSIRSKCSRLLTDCWWDKKHFPCCERFLPIETEYGVCFAFNSRLTGNDTSYIVNRQIGLPYLVFSAIEEIGIRIHAPDDMVSVGMNNILGRPVVLPKTTDFEAILKAEQTISDNSVASMSSAVRGCLYLHEKPESFPGWPFSRYSYSTCMLYCRATAQHNLCNCTHHLMPKMRGIPFCDIPGLTCLNENKDSLGTPNCDCPMSCEEIDYKLVHMFLFRHTNKTPTEIVARGTRGIIELVQLPALRVRRDAIRHMLGLVVDIGGVGGVFFGASLLNVLEIVYLAFIRRHE